MSNQRIFTRDFVLSFLGQFIFSAVFYTLIPTLPIYLSKRGVKEAEIGVLIGIASIFSLLLRPFIGKGLSKRPEKLFLVSGALVLTFSVVALLWVSAFWPLLVVRASQGISAALFFTSSFTLIANISPEQHRGQSMSIYYLSSNVAFAVAPWFGMVLINSFAFPGNFTILFLFCTALSFLSLSFVLKLGTRKVSVPESSLSGKEPLLNLPAVPPAIMACLVNVIWGTVIAFFPLYAIGHGMANPGIFFALFSIILILGRAFGGKVLDLYARQREKIILPCLMIYVIAMTLLAFSKTPLMFILVALIWGIGNALLYPMLITIALDQADANRGPAMGTYTAIADLGTGLGPVSMGLILSWTNYQFMFFCLALVGLINFLYYHFCVRKEGGVSYANL